MKNQMAAPAVLKTVPQPPSGRNSVLMTSCAPPKAVPVPVASYSVSGEYAMVKAGASLGYIEEERIISEMAVGVYRAGADIYLTYFAPEIARLMDEGRIG